MMLFFQGLFTLLFFDILNTFCNFKTLHSTVKRWKVTDEPSGADTVGRICTAVNNCCVWYPKQALCLQRAFAMTYLLRRHGVPARMVLGAQKIPFKAHAWVEVNGIAVNERSDVHANYGIWERC